MKNEIKNTCFVFFIPIFFIETKKTGRLKNKMLSIELKIKFHRLLNALGRYIRKYKISNH
jgi:hypothetical protein